MVWLFRISLNKFSGYLSNECIAVLLILKTLNKILAGNKNAISIVFLVLSLFLIKLLWKHPSPLTCLRGWSLIPQLPKYHIFSSWSWPCRVIWREWKLSVQVTWEYCLMETDGTEPLPLCRMQQEAPRTLAGGHYKFNPNCPPSFSLPMQYPVVLLCPVSLRAKFSNLSLYQV